MPISSSWDSSCKDCGTTHKKGEMIDQNANGNWCKNGKNCQGTMQAAFQGTQTFQTSQIPPNPSNIAFAKECVESFIAICANHNIDPATQQLHTVFNTGIMQKGGRR